ncbi:MAG TPA: ribulose-phosphate 3-epimerase [Solirubrobacteraceae bacterium]|nr:ribulose-phosphate 3-epimerase [Solirubrobacteraceae bacterium]
MADRSAVLRERHVAPSILSADFARLGAQVSAVLDAGARVIHVDVMDGHFVPPITFGAVIVSALADLVHDAQGILDVHMMVDRPERHVAEIARAGADGITVHAEATAHLHYTLDEIRSAGCTAGVALCPGTSPEVLDAVALDSTDLVLCMSVNPGWGGQAFIPGSVGKLTRLGAALPDRIALEVDGGVNEETAPQVARAGANLLVTGSAVFGSDDPPAAYAALTAAAGFSGVS